MSHESSPSPPGWPLAVCGLALTVFAVVALSGPGRIDIVDGQTRFAVGQSLYEYGDSIVRDERVWFMVFPGRDEQKYSYYRLPHSVMAIGAIAAADATGPVSEGRRHFFFVLCGAVSCGLLAAGYALWFRRLGLSPRASILWAAGGIFCTPSWFYGTSTFDDIFGTVAIVLALIISALTRHRCGTLGMAAVGFLFAIAFNLKPPLAAFALAALALNDDRSAPRMARLLRVGLVGLGIAAGMALYVGYDMYKFPFDKAVVHKEELTRYIDVWRLDWANPIIQLAKITVSPNGGAIWYCPALFLGAYGLVVLWRSGERRTVWAALISGGIYVGFLCSMLIAKGDLSWGPRYLTPVFAVLWLFAPVGAILFKRWAVWALLAAGLVVQLLALSIDHHRLYVLRKLPCGYEPYYPHFYFRFDCAHLFMRPIEIMDVARSRERAPEYTPAPSPTFTFPVINKPELPENGPEGVQRYHVLNSFRP